MVLKRTVADTKGAFVDTGRTDSERAIMQSINNKFTDAAREQSDKLFTASLVILRLSCLEREKRGGVQAATGHEALATAMVALESYKETLEAAQDELKQRDLAKEKLEAERDAAKKYIAKVLEEAKQNDPQALGASTSGNRDYAESAALLMAKGIYELE